jgi:ABC-type sugar transport system ATPase subunit
VSWQTSDLSPPLGEHDSPGRDEPLQQGHCPLVSVRGIIKNYGAVAALRDVDLDVYAGEVVALAGENGSGKSTLSRIVAGVTPPTQGELIVDGQQRSFATPRAALDAGIALVSQEPTSVPTLSIGENVMLPFLRRPTSIFRRREIHQIAEQLLARVGLRVDARRPLASLGSGDREMVEIAKALATSPRLLILDEATSRLPDPSHLLAVIHDLRESGTATIFITHRLREIETVADRAVVLRDGRLVGELRPPVMTSQNLSTMMVGRELTSFFGQPRTPSATPVLEVSGLVASGAAGSVTLAVRGGEIVGLAGLVGAGRTELLETILGVRPRKQGSIRVLGKEVPSGSVKAARAAGVALVPEDRMSQGLVVGASVRENIALGSHRPFSLALRSRETGLAERSITELGIRTASSEAPVSSLSGGNQQKVVLARNLMRHPKVLLLDEPTRGLDIGAKADVYEAIRTLVTKGVAVLIASSEMIELLGLCDRIVVMHDRAIAGELMRDEATEERIALLSGGEVLRA